MIPPVLFFVCFHDLPYVTVGSTPQFYYACQSTFNVNVQHFEFLSAQRLGRFFCIIHMARTLTGSHRPSKNDRIAEFKGGKSSML